jgi:hypothetical protein
VDPRTVAAPGPRLAAKLSDEARALAARGDLVELIARYSHLLNGGEFDRLETVFTEDASFLTPGRDAAMPVPVVGAAAIRAAVEQRYTKVGIGMQLRHVITATVIDQLGERKASAHSLLVLVATRRGGAAELRGSGVYHDRFVREDAGWRFAERVLALDGRRA